MGSSYTPPGGGIGGTTGTTDNAILRADGTGGSTLQAGAPATLSDAGVLTIGSMLANHGAFDPAGGGAGNPAFSFYDVAAGALACQFGYDSTSDQAFVAAGFLGTFTALVIKDSGQLNYSGNIFQLGGDVNLVRAAANTFALRNGANGQTWIVSRTFTDTSNFSQFKTVVTGSVVAFTISELGTGVGTLTGYTFDKAVLAPNIPVVDTGWTANADGGDKTAVIGSTATLDGIATALNLVTAGAGTQLENIAQKVKAIEAVLVALKLPNA